MSLYFIDSVLYIDMLGQRIRMESTIDDAESMTFGASTQTVMAADAINSLVVKEENGGKVFTYNIDPDKATDLIDSMKQQLGTEDAELTVKSLTGTMHVGSDNMLKEIEINGTMSATISGAATEITYSMVETVNAVGAAVTVAAPEDADTYTDVTNVG